jgi:hypothetical protein
MKKLSPKLRHLKFVFCESLVIFAVRIKTSIYMVWKEYIFAAERHKYACEELLRHQLLVQQQIKNPKVFVDANTHEWRLLADIYYLTGY